MRIEVQDKDYNALKTCYIHDLLYKTTSYFK